MAGFLQGTAVPRTHAGHVGPKAFVVRGPFPVTLRVSHVLLFHAAPVQQLSHPPALASTHPPDLCAQGACCHQPPSLALTPQRSSTRSVLRPRMTSESADRVWEQLQKTWGKAGGELVMFKSTTHDGRLRSVGACQFGALFCVCTCNTYYIYIYIPA